MRHRSRSVFGMRAWIAVQHGEDEFLTAARLATHRRTHDVTRADFFVVESGTLVDPSTGRMLSGRAPGEKVNGPAPRFEIQILDAPVVLPQIGRFSAVNQVVDSSGQVQSFGYSAAGYTFIDEFRTFLLTLGSATDDDANGFVSDLPETIEEFLTLWTVVSSEVPFDPEDRRIADAMASMAGEVVKTSRPPRPVVRAAFEWLASKLNRFADEFSASAGKAAGTAFGASAGVGAGAFVTGHLPRLLEAVDKVLRHV